MGAVTKILLVEDDPFNREGVKLYLEQKGQTVLEAGDAATAWHTIETSRPDVVVIDIVIPTRPNERAQIDQNVGVQLAVRLKNTYPAVGVVLFSAYETHGRDIFRLIQDGKRGIAYKLKGCKPRDLLDTILAVHAGQIIIDPEVTTARLSAQAFLAVLDPEERKWVIRAAEHIPDLAPREREAAELLGAAHTAISISRSLVISSGAVDNLRNRIYHKLGLVEMDDFAPHLSKSIILAKALILYDLQSSLPSAGL